MAKHFFLSQAMLLAAIYLSKTSSFWLVRRLFFPMVGEKETKYKVFGIALNVVYDIALGFIVLSGIASIALWCANCNFRLVLNTADACPGLVRKFYDQRTTRADHIIAKTTDNYSDTRHLHGSRDCWSARLLCLETTDEAPDEAVG